MKTSIHNLPPSLRVGPYDIKIVTLPEDIARDNYGCFTSRALEIGLCDKFPSTVFAGETLLHELLHAAWYVQGIKAKDGEERVVGNLAISLTQILRDNPTLLDWLKNALK